MREPWMPSAEAIEAAADRSCAQSPYGDASHRAAPIEELIHEAVVAATNLCCIGCSVGSPVKVRRTDEGKITEYFHDHPDFEFGIQCVVGPVRFKEGS